jgi:hypothetical protein
VLETIVCCFDVRMKMVSWTTIVVATLIRIATLDVARVGFHRTVELS